MALNLCDTSPGPAPSPVQGSRSSPPSRSPSSTSEARLKTSPSAPTTIEVADPTSKAEEETTTTATAPLESTASGGHVAQRCSSTPAPRTGPAYGNDADSVFPSGDGAIAVATAVPLAWGERSVEVERFRAEVVVMSDVVYDPAGKSGRWAAISALIFVWCGLPFVQLVPIPCCYQRCDPFRVWYSASWICHAS